MRSEIIVPCRHGVLERASVTPREIEILKEEKKSAIYRLIGSNGDAQRARAVFRDIG